MPALPARFLWGTATSSYQIEGGVDLDGRGPSIWDTFCTSPGNVRNGDGGTVADDHRNRMPEDVALLSDLGATAYRFSVAWPRVQPTGTGPVSQPGLDFYRQLVDELLGRGIEPFVTLYHWDLPQPLEDAGGWPARSTAERFAEYAGIVGSALGDRVRHWSTLNEPWCVSMLGYAAGVHAPGRTDPGAAVAAAHHLLLAHGLAVDVLRGRVADGELGITLNPAPVICEGDTEEDRDAARRVDGIANGLWFEPLLRGRYPDDVLDDIAPVSDLRHIGDGDLAQISRPIDFLGLNYYRPYHVRHRLGASAEPPASQWPGSPDVDVFTPSGPVTAIGWSIEPYGLRELLDSLAGDTDAPPLYVHEAGAAFDDQPDDTGFVDDQDRVAWLEAHLREALAARERGVDLRGFFVWSLLDNFEWSEGYAMRFGIVRVDYQTLDRFPKASARWFAQVARGHDA